MNEYDENELTGLSQPGGAKAAAGGSASGPVAGVPVGTNPPLLAAAVSGLYVWNKLIITPLPIPQPVPVPVGTQPGVPAGGPITGGAEPLLGVTSEELRLDVDRYYPQMAASGVINRGVASRVNWIASLKKTATDTWAGTIWYKDGATSSFPYAKITIKVLRVGISDLFATATFGGGSTPDRIRVYKFKSPFFHDVNFEFDSAKGESPTTSILSCAHPNRPAGLPCETLTIQKVYNRAGFQVTTNATGAKVGLGLAGADAVWSNNEMHDAMQKFWSRFDNKAQWALWTFFASLHEEGDSLGGVMFDDIGPNHRQGTSIFNDAFISRPPAGDPNPSAWVKRMIFWTACHEMGHAFNLAHSWQKAHPPEWGTPWIPLANEPQVRSFMNYPFKVTGGQTAFFADFEFRFSDSELLFLRHAPERFVQQGNAAWFDHHGFQSAEVSEEPALKLELRVNRERPVFEFMEPVTLELKLSNVSQEPVLVEEKLLMTTDAMTVVIKKENQPARQYVSYSQYCLLPRKKVLNPGEAVYESLFISAGLNGWDISEPGNYMVQVALHVDDEDVVSNPLKLRVAPPRNFNEENLAQDFFSEDVGRIISFDGSRVLEGGVDTLQEVAAQMKDRRVALHANLALGSTNLQNYKELVTDGGEGDLKVTVRSAKPEAAIECLRPALVENSDDAAESLGHIDYQWYVDKVSALLAKQGARKEATSFMDSLFKTLSNRTVNKRKVLGEVLEGIKAKRDTYAAGRTPAAETGSPRNQVAGMADVAGAAKKGGAARKTAAARKGGAKKAAAKKAGASKKAGAKKAGKKG